MMSYLDFTLCGNIILVFPPLTHKNKKIKIDFKIKICYNKDTG